jgi:hypothetical protein
MYERERKRDSERDGEIERDAGGCGERVRWILR